jgi:flagellar hook assembly protein FlgD
MKDFDDYFDTSNSTWDLRTGKKQSLAEPGKYKAVVEWQAWVNNRKYTMSVSKTFMIHEKDLKGSKPAPSPSSVPQNKPDIYVDLNTEKQDGKLNIGIALLNKSNEDVTFDFSSLKQYDVIIRNSANSIVFDTRGSISGTAISHVSVNAGETYNFISYPWNFTDQNGKKVPAGKYTVQVVMSPMNKGDLSKKYNLVLEDTAAVAVSDEDIRYDVDVLLGTEWIGRQLMLDFAVRNRTSGDITVQFRSALRYKVMLYNKSGTKVYEYPSDTMSAQYLAEDVIGANSSRQYGSILVPDLDLAPGEYTARLEFYVLQVFDKNGNEINKNLCSFTTVKTLNLTELDVNNYAAVAADPAIEGTSSGSQLVLPFSLYNVSDAKLDLRFNKPNYTIIILDSANNVVFTKYDEKNLYNQVILSAEDSLDFGKVTWDMKDQLRRRVYGDITIIVTVNADMYNVEDKYNSELSTVQKLNIVK